jgi:hypothetical protein
MPMKDIRVGQKFRHIDGDDYIVCSVNGEYCLICYDVHHEDNSIYLGCSYKGGTEEDIGEIFGGIERNFKEIC